MSITAHFDGFEHAFDELAQSLERELDAALVRGAEFVANAAQREHPYTNRTYLLERSTHASGTVQKLLGSGSETEVWGDTFYGDYLESGTDRIPPGKYSFLAPAWERSEDAVVQILERGMFHAADRTSGWRAEM